MPGHSAPPRAVSTIVVPFPTPLAPVSAVRSTLLIASVAALRAAGLFERYEKALAREHREAVLECVAGCWVSTRASIAHYRACDSLGLTSLEQMAMGRQTGDGIRHHLTRAVRTLACHAGLSPWTALEHFNRFWARSFLGGGVAVAKLGPKDAEITYGRCLLLQSPYFRSALRGVALGLLEVMSTRVVMCLVSFDALHDEARYRVAWV